MYIYAVSVHVSEEIKDEWLRWMREVHIPEVMKTGCFREAKLFEVQSDQDSAQGIFSVQYTYDKPEDYKRYECEFAARLRKEHADKFGATCHAFRSHAVLMDTFK